MRYLIGKEKLLKVLRQVAYPHKNMELITDGRQCRFITTDEFFTIVEKVSRQDLEWFKKVYFRNAALPELSVVENKKGEVTLKWITKENSKFPMPLEIKTKDGISKVYFENGSAHLDFAMENIIEIDPNKWILFNEKDN